MRIERAKEQLGKVIDGEPGVNVLDIGSGTGTDSFALEQLGCNVIGIDNSPNMVEIARSRQTASTGSIRFEVDDLVELKSVPDRWADIILCRGNLIPHLITIEDLKKAIAAMSRAARKGGLLIIGWLNYRLILKAQTRLIGVSGDEFKTLLRFNDFNQDGSVDFNIVTLEREAANAKWRTDWQTTRLTPWSADDVGMLLVEHRWGELEIASSLTREEFDPDTSKDVFIFAVRG